MKRFLPHLIFIAIAMGVGLAASRVAPVGEWYLTLEKPFFNPPGWVFPIAWNALFIMIGISGGMIWNAGQRGLPFLLWLLQAGLNGLWSLIFFGAQMPALALVEVVILLAVILAYIRATWNENRTAALLFVPYAAWVSFATILNATIVWLNW